MNLRLETLFQRAALLLITSGVLTSPPMVEAQEGLSIVRAERYEKYLLAQIARMQGNGETALKYFREVIEIDPQSDAGERVLGAGDLLIELGYAADHHW